MINRIKFNHKNQHKRYFRKLYALIYITIQSDDKNARFFTKTSLERVLTINTTDSFIRDKAQTYHV